MQLDLNRVIEQVSKEKGIDKGIVINAVEEMMHSAAKRTFGPDRRIESRFNQELGEIELFEIKTVVEQPANLAEISLEESHSKYDPDAEIGDEILLKLDTATMGRIAAQAAKQNLIQHIRDAERKQIYSEFKDRKNEVVSGIVQRFERKNMIVNLGRTEAILPEKEQIPHERYRQSDRIRALIAEVDLSEKGLSIILSRTSNDFLRKLFEQEVPGDLRGHRRDSPMRARTGRTRQGGGLLQRLRRRSGRRLRRDEGHAGAIRGAGVARRKDRYRAMDRGSGRTGLPRAGAGQGVQGDHR